jgi:hypothetical protein
MPVFATTSAQAARLFSLDPARCERVMSALVDEGILAWRAGTYVRANSGRSAV